MIDREAASNYKAIKEVLERLTGLCRDSSLRPKKHEQRLLRNMGAHTVILELLQIPYEKVVNTRDTREVHIVLYDCCIAHFSPAVQYCTCTVYTIMRARHDDFTM